MVSLPSAVRVLGSSSQAVVGAESMSAGRLSLPLTLIGAEVGMGELGGGPRGNASSLTGLWGCQIGVLGVSFPWLLSGWGRRGLSSCQCSILGMSLALLHDLRFPCSGPWFSPVCRAI